LGGFLPVRFPKEETMDRNTEIDLEVLRQSASSCRAQLAALIAIDGGFMAFCLTNLVEGKRWPILWTILFTASFVVFGIGYTLYLRKQKSVTRQMKALKYKRR